MNDKTIEYYNHNADLFIQNTLYVDFRKTQDEFLSHLPKKAMILDFGCGSGRDTKYFLEKGYRTEAIDGSEELCKSAKEYTGIDVKHMLFCELEKVSYYDGIWACSSILHLSRQELKDVLSKMIKALKQEGVIYTSFKYGDFEGYRNNRYFTDFTMESFTSFIEDSYKDENSISIERFWITGDVRPDRGEEKWLNIILRKD